MTSTVAEASLVAQPSRSRCAWLWPGGAARLAGRAVAGGVLRSGATPEVAGRFGLATRVEGGTANLLHNPSFEADASAWTAQSSASIMRVTTGALFGACCLEVATAEENASGVRAHPDIAHKLPVSAGLAYTFSLHARRMSAGSSAMNIGINWYDASDAFISADYSGVTLASTAWTRVGITATAPLGAASARFLDFNTAGALTPFEFCVDGAQFEQRAGASSYCDGSLGAGYAWAGTAHASPSTRAAGRVHVPVPRGAYARGAVALWWRPGQASDAAGDRTLLRWGGADTHLDLTYRPASDRFELTSKVSSVSADVVQSSVQTFAAGDDVLLVASWERGRISLAVSHEAYAHAARTAGVPAIEAVTADLGSDGAGARAGGALGPVLWCAGPLSAAQASVLAQLERMPRLSGSGEVV